MRTSEVNLHIVFVLLFKSMLVKQEALSRSSIESFAKYHINIGAVVGNIKQKRQHHILSFLYRVKLIISPGKGRNED